MRSILFVLLSLPAAAFAQPVPLFDGRTLDGWEGSTELWKVEDGEIRGGSLTEKVTHNDFLSTRKTYADFELRVKLRLSGTGFVNSGVQIRSVRMPGSPETAGYQVDYGKGWYGKLYDESRRNKVIAESKDMAAVNAAIKEGEWNEYRIRAQGPRIQSWINGVPALDYTETDPAIVLDGQIAIQIHGGGAAQVQAKDIFIEELPQASPLKLKIEGADLAPKGLVAAAGTTLKAWYPRLRHILGADYATAQEVTLKFTQYDGVARTTGDVIEAGAAHFAAHPDDVGALVHELAHVIQGYPPGAPGWLVEGIADYARYYYFEPERGAHFKPAPGQDYQAGYNPAAALLARVQVGRPVSVVAELNRRGHAGKLNEAAFKEVTGMTPDEAWQWVLGNKPKPAADAKAKPADGKRDLSYNNVQGTALTAEEELKKFHLPPGYEIELVLKESPGIGKFVSVAFDQRGRMWTQTALEYPVDGNENPAAADALYASKAKDKVLVFPREALNAPLPEGGLVNPTIFADGLAIPLGLLPWGNGDSAYILHGHDVVLFKDSDGDGRADRSEVVLTGFGVQDSHLFPHQFTRAPGGWIWMAQGLFNNSKVHKPGSEAVVDFPKCSMARMRPDGSQFEVTSVGPNNIWGLATTKEGETFIQEANDYGYPVMPFREYSYYPGGMESLKKSYQPEFPPAAEFRMGGTGLSGLALGDEEFRKLTPSIKNDGLCMFVANPITSRVHTLAMHRDGTNWKLEQAADLITSDDPFFRPVGMTVGPDGNLYIVDWYNKIISHNEVPRNHPDRDKTRGRIWRVKPKGAKPSDVPDMTAMPTENMLDYLESTSPWAQQVASEILADRKTRDLVPTLKTLVNDENKSADTRIHALWAWEQIGEADTKPLAIMLKDANPAIRREAARALTSFAGDIGAENAACFLKPLAKDADANVRRAALLTLGTLAKPTNLVLDLMMLFAQPSLPGPLGQSSRGPKQIPVREAYDREYERFLARLFLERHPEAVAKYLDTPEAGKLPVESRVLASLALEPKASAVRVAKLLPKLDRAPNEEELLRLAQYPVEPGCGEALKALLANDKSRAAVVDKLLAQKTKLDPAKISPLLNDAAKALLGGKDNERALGVSLIGGFQLAALEKDLVEMLPGDGTTGTEGPRYVAALQVLRELRSGVSEVFAKLAKSPDPMVRDEALAALASSKNPNAAEQLFALYPTLNTAQQRSALNALSSTKPGAHAIVAALAANKIPKTDLDGPTAERLSLVLGDDPELAKLMQNLGHVFHNVLALDGQDTAWVDSKITLDGPFTVECWVRLAPGIGNEDEILGTPGGMEMNFFQSKFRVYAGSALHDVAVAKKPMTPDLWTHIAVTRDAKGEIKIYQNGELDAAGTKPAPAKWENCRIGWSGPKKGTEGMIAEFRVWPVERTAAEIRANFDRSLKSGSSAKNPGGPFKPLVLSADDVIDLKAFQGVMAEGKGPALGKGARIAKVTDYPPLLTKEQADALDTKFAKYSALGHKPGNVANGKVLSAICLACHTIGTTGGQIGPNLSGAGAMGLEGVLRNIVTPNAAMEAGYRIFRTELKSGDIVDAFFVSEDKEAFVVRQPGLQDRRIPKKEVRTTKYIRRSLMPEGLLDALNDEQVTDLLSYLMTLK